MGGCRENIWRVRRVKVGNEPAPGEIWAMLMMKQVEILYRITSECENQKPGISKLMSACVRLD